MGAVKLNISVSDIATVMLSFTHIRVSRSVDGETGTYTPITASSATPAVLTAPTIQSYNVVGKTLQLLVDSEAQVDILFTGVGYLTAAQAADQIDTAVGAAIGSAVDGYLTLTSVLTGTASKMEIVGGSAAAEFGWVAGDRDIGDEANIPLTGTQSLYEFVDNDGEEGYWYKVQYYNSTTGLQSNFSSAFLGVAATMIGADKLSIGSVDLIDSRGIAVADQEITFYSVHEPLIVDGFNVAMIRAPVTIITDNVGHAEIPLVKGLKVKVVFEGTSLIRDITVPDTDFDVLTEMGSAQDPFSVVQPSFPFALRRSL